MKLDPTKLPAALSTRLAVAVSVTVLAAGIGGFAMVNGTPAGSHHPLVLSAGDSSSSSSSTSSDETSETSTETASTAASTEASHSSTTNHGDVVTSAVSSCRAALTAGQHGIGSCVAPVASDGRSGGGQGGQAPQSGHAPGGHGPGGQGG